jgi:pimeloyl-ACP methyl ester carboxylesterase
VTALARRRAAALLVAVAALAPVLLGACSSSPSAGGAAAASRTAIAVSPSTTTPAAVTSTTTGTSSTSSTSTSTSTSTTVTTVVPPRPLAGTAAGSGGLGPVQRVPVVPLPDGLTVPPETPAGPSGLAASVEVAFRRFGSGPPLLLVCGQRCTMTSWDASLLHTLARQFRVVVFDLPGTGYSGPLHARNTVAAQADVVAGLVPALGLSGTTLLGWGVGGEVAMAVAERHPGVVDRLVLLDATAGGPRAVAPAAAVSAALASPEETTAQLSMMYFPASAGVARLAWLADLSGPAPDDLPADEVASSAALAAAAWAGGSVAAGISRLHVPVLVLAGADDRVVPPQNSARLAAQLHVADVVLAGAGYASMAVDRTAVIARIASFAGRAAGASGASGGSGASGSSGN